MSPVRLPEERVQHFHDQDEEKRGEQVALSQPAGVVDALPGASVDKDLGRGRGKNGGDPVAPACREAQVLEYLQQAERP